MTATTAHAGTQAGIRPVLLGCPHCGIPALLLRIDPDPGHRHPDRPVRSRRLHRPPGRSHPPPRHSNPAPSARPMHLLRLEHPAANFPDHLTPAGQ